MRNCLYAVNAVINSTVNGLIFSASTAILNGIRITVGANIFAIASYGVNGVNYTKFTGKVVGAALGFYAAQNSEMAGYIYSCQSGVMGGGKFGTEALVTGTLGYDANGYTKANTSDFDFSRTPYLLCLNTKTPNPPIYGFRNNKLYWGRVKFEHYLQVANSVYVTDAWGDLQKLPADGGGGRPAAPPSGAANVIKMLNPQSNLSATYWLDIIPRYHFRVWQKAGTVVYKIFVQAPTGNNSDYAAADLVLYADYISTASPLALATANSTEAVARANNWTKYLSVSITSAADGWVTLYLRLMKYYAAADVLYVDPGIWAGGNLCLGDWSMGELVYPGPSSFGGGVNPAVLPLGVMEAVQ